MGRARRIGASILTEIHLPADDDRRQHLHELEAGTLHRFADWPNPTVPKVAAGVYSVWDNGRFIYVGMSGRALTREQIDAPDEPVKAKGLWTRLDSHASGRRSGDQFCVYICDRFVVPYLTPDQQAELATGALSLDVLTRKVIRDRFGYRYCISRSGRDAYNLERDVQKGALAAGKPLLNPL